MNMSKQQPVWVGSQAVSRIPTGPSALAALVSMLVAARVRVTGIVAARLRLARDRREILAMGPYARMELHKMLLARGEGGIDLRLWSDKERQRDEAAQWGQADAGARGAGRFGAI